jgi:hypothetical protein
MEMSCLFHAPDALCPGKQPPAPIVQETGWVPEPIWTLWSREKSVTPAKNRIPAVYAIACRYTDRALPVPDDGQIPEVL